MRVPLILSVVVIACGCSPSPEPASRQPAAAPDTAPAPAPTPSQALRWPRPDSSGAPRLFWFAEPSDSLAALVPECAPTSVPFDGDSVGPVRVGQTLAALLERCPQPLALWDEDEEGGHSPGLAMRFGAVVVVARVSDTIPDATVGSLTTGSALARTASGVGVGMPLDSAAKLLGTPFLEDAITFGSDYFASFPGQRGLLLTLVCDGPWWDRSPGTLPRGCRVTGLTLTAP